MKINFLNKLALIVLISVLAIALGCSAAKSTYELSTKTARSLTDKLKPGDDPILKKRVLLPLLIDNAGLGMDDTVMLSENLAELLREEDHFLFKSSTEQLYKMENIRSIQYGVIMEPSLIQKAREMRMDVLLLGIINPFESTVKKTGIWPFRKIKREIELSIAMNALNIANNTLFLTHLETRSIKVDEEKIEGTDDIKSIDFKFLLKPAMDIIEDHASEIVRELNRQSWQGETTFSDDGKLTINGGEDIGVTKGQIFEVFSKGAPIISNSGQEYHIKGPRVGELQVENVMQDYSVVVPLSDSNSKFKEGQIVRVKR